MGRQFIPLGQTALASKTILSLCNSFFTHALNDQTSLGFLESVYSSQHTKLIPNLGRFEFLAYGKALMAERPLLVRREFAPDIQKASDALNHNAAEAEGIVEEVEGDLPPAKSLAMMSSPPNLDVLPNAPSGVVRVSAVHQTHALLPAPPP